MAEQITVNTGMTESQQAALPELLDMVAEYEASDQGFEDQLKHALNTEEYKKPNRAVRAASASPLERESRKMSMQLDEIQDTATAPATKTTTAPVSAPTCASPILQTHPSLAALPHLRPLHSLHNPWYYVKLNTADAISQLKSILADIHSNVSRWNLEFSPEGFRAYARKAKTNWNNTTNPQLRQMHDGLRNMHEYLVCGPQDWLFAHALSTRDFMALQDAVHNIDAHVTALARVEGCSWLNQAIGRPLADVEGQVAALMQERQHYKDTCWSKLSDADKLPYQVGDMQMSGT